MTNLYDTYRERGFLYQSTDEAELRKLLDTPGVSMYIGFDPTADSLHVGSLVPIMSLAHAQRAGHRPIAIVGGGTAMVGDPSGKTEMRQMLTREQIKANMEGLKQQLSNYFEFGPQAGLMIDNGDWLLDLKYVDFLREIGRHFSVNRMLAAESYKLRLETGLSFIEFNYMLLQAYDFYVLSRDHGCRLQMGGQDQWGNIVAGIELIRRMGGEAAHALTFPLLMKSNGEKFGKTASGAIWLSPEKTPPYEFYQFWRNTEDQDLGRFLGLFTFLPMEEVARLSALEGSLLNRAKEILAFEATAITHGVQKAREAYLASAAAFGLADPEGRVETSSGIRQVREEVAVDLPSSTLEIGLLTPGLAAAELFVAAGLVKSKGEARRLIRGGGAYINDERVDDENQLYTASDLVEGALTLRAGKKRYHRLAARG